MGRRSVNSPFTRSQGKIGIIPGLPVRITRRRTSGRRSTKKNQEASVLKIEKNDEKTNVQEEKTVDIRAEKDDQNVTHADQVVPQVAPPPLPYDSPRQALPSPELVSNCSNACPVQSEVGDNGLESEIRQPRNIIKLIDSALPVKVSQLETPEMIVYKSQVAFEKKLDEFMMKRKLILEERMNTPWNEMGKLRIFIHHEIMYPNGDTLGDIPEWRLVIKGDVTNRDGSVVQNAKFSSFLDSITVFVCSNAEGADPSLLAEWKRVNSTAESDGFQIRRPWVGSVWLQILIMPHFKEELFVPNAKLHALLGLNRGLCSLSQVSTACWHYIKNHQLQDSTDNSYVNCDRVLQQIFGTPRLRFQEIQVKLRALLRSRSPPRIPHFVSFEDAAPSPVTVVTINYEVEGMRKHVESLNCSWKESQSELSVLEDKIKELNAEVKTAVQRRDLFEQFAVDPQRFILQANSSLCQDLKIMLDRVGNIEVERRAAFYHEPWIYEAVTRYLHYKNSEQDNIQEC